jgi:glycosyltransferase involved in cell wall biosynthesis
MGRRHTRIASSVRVLHVIPSVAVSDGGPSKAIAMMERALSDASVEVTTLTTDHGLDRTAPGNPVLPRGPNGAARIYARKWFTPYKIAPAIAPFLARHIRDYDVVHIHALFSFAPTIAAWMARFHGVPYILRPLGTLGAYGLDERRRCLKRTSIALVERAILRHAAAVHFTSQRELDEAQARGLAFRGALIPLGVKPDDTMERPAELFEIPAALKGRRTVLFLSRLDPKKNLEALVDAFASSQALATGAVLLVAGAGEPAYVESLKRRAAEVAVSDRIVWLGHLSGARKRTAFAAADVFVLPSFSENFGIAAVEALQAGLPCILGDGVAIASEIERAGCGLAIQPDAPSIASALERVLSDDALRARMASGARGFAEREYSTQVMAQRLVALYQDVQRSGRPGARENQRLPVKLARS